MPCLILKAQIFLFILLFILVLSWTVVIRNDYARDFLSIALFNESESEHDFVHGL